MPRIPIKSRLTSLNAVKHFCETMRTASVRDLRQNFPAVMRWIKEGENVAITMRRKIVARLIPERPPRTRSAPAPDFDLIAQRIFGSQKFGGNLADLERQG
jgi:antitoxin (DNA-binding transcriptional repressor) of toxin-antitoxin stability system